MGIDIFDITKQFYAKYPKIKIENIINKTELKVEVEVEIMNTGDVKIFIKIMVFFSVYYNYKRRWYSIVFCCKL